jgi:HEAT repeat protein
MLAWAGPGELRNRAIEVLVEAANGPDAALRSNAVEALQVDPSRALPVVHKGLSDENPGVRFAAAVTVGMLRFQQLSSALEPLLEDANASVKAAALYALHVLGAEVDITPLADMLASQDPSLRGNVALLLGLMGNESAVPMLKRAGRQSMPRASEAQKAVVRVQIAEAVARLGDNSSLDALRASAFSQYHEVKVLAITAMGAVGDRSMEVALVNLLSDPGVPQPRKTDEQTAAALQRLRAELQLAAAGALARLGNMRGMDVAIRLSGADDPAIRAQAAWVMGWMRDDATGQRLASLLSDPVPHVRVPAAAAVLRRTGSVAGK